MAEIKRRCELTGREGVRPTPPIGGDLQVETSRCEGVNECTVRAVVTQRVVTVVANRAAGTADDQSLHDDIITVI